ncbi:MAG: AMP-binding protein [Clostridia bacterium]|nr:AMP-binding protein [Clostridia bacterium]
MSKEEKLQALNQVLEHCKNSPFYKDRLPAEPLTAIEDLKNIPLTTKEDIRDNSPFGFICVPKKELYQYHETFGTTGVPGSTWLTSEDMLDQARRANNSGIKFCEDDIVLVRFPYAISTVAHFTHMAAQLKGACVVPASSRTTVSPFTRIVSLMRKLGVTVLAGLPLQAVLIAETAEMMGLRPDKDFPELRALYTAGEVLTPGKRKLLEDIWKVPVSDNYGMTEIGPAVTDCVHDVPHPMEDSFIFEILDADLKEEVQQGEIGYLVVTTLTRKATPLVRYVTGDRARMVEKECSCGKKTSLEIRGRRNDIIKVGDRILDMWDLDEIISHLPFHRFWVVGPEEKGLKYVVEKEREVDTVSIETMEMLENKYNLKLNIEVVPKGTLYDRSELLHVGCVGKPQYIYSALEMSKKAYVNSAKN